MARSLSVQEVNQLALLGAQARLTSLRAEMQSLLEAFPDLARGSVPSSSRRGRKTSGTTKRGRKKRKMTAEQRRAVSERMSKYWAARRKEKK